jgi:hypothetical protein
MVKATLVFVSNDPEAIAKTKQSFVEFFGMRMVADTCPETPILRMNTSVDSYDMNQLSSYIPENMTVLVVTSDESVDIMSQNYVYLQMG